MKYTLPFLVALIFLARLSATDIGPNITTAGPMVIGTDPGPSSGYPLRIGGSTLQNGNLVTVGGGWASMTTITANMPAGGQVRFGNGKMVADNEVWGLGGLGMSQFARLSGGFVSDLNAWSLIRATNQINIMQSDGTNWQPVFRVSRNNEMTSVANGQAGAMGGYLIASRGTIGRAPEVATNPNPPIFYQRADGVAALGNYGLSDTMTWTPAAGVTFLKPDGSAIMAVTPSGQVAVANVLSIGPVTPIRQLHFGNSSGAEMVMEKTTALANYKKWNLFVGGADNAKSALLLRQLNDSGTDGAISTTWDGNGMMSIYGAAPDAVEAGRVAIGGGKISANEARVNGLITAKEIRVTLSVWADSVFSASYRLPSLSEVSAAIQRDGHLPGVPSEKEVVAEGLSVGDMSRLHMAKIEELTLYAIQADSTQRKLLQEIATQQAANEIQNQQLVQENLALAARLERIEKVLAMQASSSMTRP